MSKKQKPGVQRRVAKNNLTRAAKKVISDNWIRKFYESDDWEEKLKSLPCPASFGEIAEYIGAPEGIDIFDLL